MEFLPPESGQSYDIVVPPGKTKTIIIKCDPEGYSMSSSTTTQVIPGSANLEQLALEKGKKNPRPCPETGDHFEIYQYSYQHGGGHCYLYVNNTTDKVLEEEIEFTLQGLEIEGKPGENSIEVIVNPGERKMVKLVATGGPWKIQQSIAYGVY